jgi:hypothetical protein
MELHSSHKSSARLPRDSNTCILEEGVKHSCPPPRALLMRMMARQELTALEGRH